MALGLDLLATLASALTAKHFLKLFEYVAEPTLRSSPFVELARETFKPPEAPLAKWIASSCKWVLATERILCLLVSSHSCLIINSPLVIITQRLVSVVDFAEFLLGLRCFVYVRMILLGKFEICFFNVRLRCTPINA